MSDLIFSLCFCIHESGAVVLGMNGPYIVFNSREDAADYLHRLADKILTHKDQDLSSPAESAQEKER